MLDRIACRMLCQGLECQLTLCLSTAGPALHMLPVPAAQSVADLAPHKHALHPASCHGTSERALACLHRGEGQCCGSARGCCSWPRCSCTGPTWQCWRTGRTASACSPRSTMWRLLLLMQALLSSQLCHLSLKGLANVSHH